MATAVYVTLRCLHRETDACCSSVRRELVVIDDAYAFVGSMELRTTHGAHLDNRLGASERSSIGSFQVALTSSFMVLLPLIGNSSVSVA